MPNLMWQWLDGFPEQIQQAAELSLSWNLSEMPAPRSVTFLGIGGSAIGADLILGLYRDSLKCPIQVVRGAQPPPWLTRDDLVIAISYSGETRETLEALQQALSRGARAAALSSGGTLLTLAQKQRLPSLQIPSGMAPRAALGYTSIPLIYALRSLKVLEAESPDIETLKRQLETIRVEWGDAAGSGAGVARRLLRRLPYLIGFGLCAGAARRLQAQLAENAKAASILFEIPEALHNLIETLDPSALDQFAPMALFLEDPESEEARREELRMIRATFQRQGLESLPILAQGTDPLVRLFTLIHKCDWISYHLAMLKGVDPVAIPVITALKQEMTRGKKENSLT